MFRGLLDALQSLAFRYRYSDNTRNFKKILHQQACWVFYIPFNPLVLWRMSQFLYKSKFTVYETNIFIPSNCPLRKIMSKEHRRFKCTELFLKKIFNCIKIKFSWQMAYGLKQKKQQSELLLEFLVPMVLHINGLMVIIRRKSLAFMAEWFLPIYSAPVTVWKNCHWSDLILRILYCYGSLPAQV